MVCCLKVNYFLSSKALFKIELLLAEKVILIYVSFHVLLPPYYCTSHRMAAVAPGCKLKLKEQGRALSMPTWPNG